MQTLRSGLLVLLTAVMLPSAACRRAPTDEERIRTLVDDAARAAAEKRVGDVVKDVSETFHGEGLDRRGVKQLVAFHVLRGSWLAVLIAGTRVEVHGDDADALVDVVLSRTGNVTRIAEVIPAEATVHRFTLRLAREREGWKVTAATWRPISLAEALAGPDAARPQ